MLTIVVRGAAVQQGSKNSMLHRTTGHVVQFETNAKALRIWRSNIKARSEVAMNGQDPLDGPLVLAVTITRSRPKSASRRRPVWPHTKPDWDKLARAICDGLTEGRACQDDARIVRAMVIKSYTAAEPPELYTGTDPEHMLRLWTPGPDLDALDEPGAVIRLAHLTEFDGIRKLLAMAGYEPKDVQGGC